MSKQIYRKVCDGGSISNKELRQAIEDYTAAEQALFKLGPSFEITRKAISMTLITLVGFEHARQYR